MSGQNAKANKQQTISVTTTTAVYLGRLLVFFFFFVPRALSGGIYACAYTSLSPFLLPFALAFALPLGPVADPEIEYRGSVGHTSEAPQPGAQSAQVSAFRAGQGAAVVGHGVTLFSSGGRWRCAARHSFLDYTYEV